MSNNLNSILIEGNMVREPRFRNTPKGTPVCTFSLASNRYLRQDTGFEKEVSFFEVETWSKLAETCNSLGKKGRGVRVVGRLKQDRWTGNDGKLCSRITIVAEHVEFRPEFKKEEKSETTTASAAVSAAIPAAPAREQTHDYYGENSYSGIESAPVMAEEMLEAVAF
jgi:single-strand DNA-binding protein